MDSAWAGSRLILWPGRDGPFLSAGAQVVMVAFESCFPSKFKGCQRCVFKLVGAAPPPFGSWVHEQEVGVAGVDRAEKYASDRYLAEGTIEDLRKEEGGAQGYAKRHRHGEIGKGLNDYDAIFTELKSKGFNGWISIEDGVDGMQQLARSVEFLKNKIAQHWAV